MEERSMLKNQVLKTIAFLTLPIFAMIIIVDCIIIYYAVACPEIKENKDFYDTDMFIDSYMGEVERKGLSLKDEVEGGYFIDEYGYWIDPLEDSDRTPIYVQDGEYKIYYQTNHTKKKFIYLLVNEETKIAYTNIQQTSKTNTIEKLKQVIISNNKYWSISNNQIQTNVERLSEENIVRNEDLQKISEFSMNKQYYTAFDETVQNLDSTSDITLNRALYNQTKSLYKYSYSTLIISIIIGSIELIYLIYSLGYVKNKEEIYLSWLDKIPLEILFFGYFLLFFVEAALLAICLSVISVDVNLCVMLIMLVGYFSVLSALYGAGTLLKRIKVHTFFKNSVTYRILKWLVQKYKNVKNTISSNKNLGGKIALYFIGIVTVSILIGLIFKEFGILLDIVFWIWCYYKIMKEVDKFKQIHDATEKIYKGDTDIKLDESLYTGVLKELAIYINDIAGGFSNAIKESLKSERLKTELITNVSHDIKTPLTSIINYVDLLKQENIQNEKAKEYIEVLDNKSQRLKKLIEDLVEASKASSGNIKINKEVLNVKELLNQVTGEFEDKFNSRCLNIISKLPEETVYIKADSRYLYRVLENTYSNVAKYAEENTRVYIDCILEEKNTVAIYVKNISKDELNISADELMQRFVRGDKSRNTEGSGLGLSIAKSLTELQDGTFNIYLDGDLFKVAIKFKRV
ncbi:histidine kinase A domain protein [Clostridium sp. CAG:354]|jgi:signal transduction histidine kinase|nr:HAMP domain-containing histidine kinase [Clostridium sp.]CDE11228.1 histidine kinase A domain protein [Clostridium sp. CAG:354]